MSICILFLARKIIKTNRKKTENEEMFIVFNQRFRCSSNFDFHSSKSRKWSEYYDFCLSSGNLRTWFCLFLLEKI